MNLVSVSQASNLLGAMTTSSPTDQSTGSSNVIDGLPASADVDSRVQDTGVFSP